MTKQYIIQNRLGHTHELRHLLVELGTLVRERHALSRGRIHGPNDTVQLFEGRRRFLLRQFHAPHHHHALVGLTRKAEFDGCLDGSLTNAAGVVDKGLARAGARGQSTGNGVFQTFDNGGFWWGVRNKEAAGTLLRTAAAVGTHNDGDRKEELEYLLFIFGTKGSHASNRQLVDGRHGAKRSLLPQRHSIAIRFLDSLALVKCSIETGR